ncbi:hypothetical protein L3X38_024329 [Prunus dulcis]|uniref:Uncharacterized protein n=1 Tax=Prunus dulcis TaxID=3755 RepID=A0AAD4W0F8_PRUDU|nr:hypothetical protein L3X38_024329 [Prunus dulcis]
MNWIHPPKRLGQEIQTAYAPKAWRSFCCSSFISRVLATRILSYGSTNIAFAPYGEYWRLLRKICTQELLSAKHVRSYRPIREEEVQNLIKSIASRAGSPINLTQEIYSSTFTITSRAAFGKKTRDQEKFIYIVKEAIKAASGFALADVFPSISLLHLLRVMRPKLERLHKEADRIMGNIIKEHQGDMVTTKSGEGEAEEDLVDVLLKFHVHGNELEFSLTTENIKAVILASNFWKYRNDTSLSTSPGIVRLNSCVTSPYLPIMSTASSNLGYHGEGILGL